MNINKLTKAVNRNLKICKLKALFKTANKLKNYLCYKDLLPENLRSNCVYKCSCGTCTASYKGKTHRHMKIRVSEQQCVSQRIGKHVNRTFSKSVRDHMLICNHQVGSLGRFQNNWERVQQIYIRIQKNLVYQKGETNP